MELSLKKAIPEIVKNIRDGIMYLLAGVLPFSSLVAPKLGMSIEDFAGWCGFGIVAVKMFAKFFGVGETEAQENIVKAIKDAGGKKVDNIELNADNVNIEKTDEK